MANSSDVFGTFSIKGKSKKSIETLLKLKEIFEKDACYSTNLVLDGYSSENTATGSFTATGRWSFKSNVDCFFDCIDTNSDNDEVVALSKEIFDEAFEIKFDFIDSESGSNFVHSGLASATYNAGDKEIAYDICNSGDYTVENLIDYGVYEFGEIFSVQWLIDNYDEYFKNKELYMKYREEILEILNSCDFKESVYDEFEDLVVEYPTLEEFLIENNIL